MDWFAGGPLLLPPGSCFPHERYTLDIRTGQLTWERCEGTVTAEDPVPLTLTTGSKILDPAEIASVDKEMLALKLAAEPGCLFDLPRYALSVTSVGQGDEALQRLDRRVQRR